MIAALVCLAAMLALHLATPFWWWVMAVPFAYGAATATSGWRAIRTGMLAAGLLWLGAGTFLYLAGGRIIAARMARMFGLGRPWTMVAATALVAALAAGLAGYAGCAVRGLIGRKMTKEPS
ncbi:MAG: hypothetical protein JW775_10175 [Candidatus Aminicenantes bacterium]|nr:hypothetical protein [Candidatus Aminicenantes bacterium]